MDMNTCNPSKLSIKEKIKLVRETDGLLIDILEGETIKGYLFLDNCTSLTHLPEDLEVGRDLYLSCCTSLTHLPNNLKVGGYLWLGGCTSLKSIPNTICVKRYIYLPDHLKQQRGLHGHKYL